MYNRGMKTFHYDGFEFDADTRWEPPQPGNGMRGFHEIELENVKITDSKAMIDAYGLAESVIMMCDLEAWILDNCEQAIIEGRNDE
jgi:hypothetical protein